MFGPNHILVTLMWGDGCSPGQENVCLWFLNRYISNYWVRQNQGIGCFLENVSNFQNWSKVLCLGVSEATNRLLRVEYTLCATEKVNRHLSKKMKKKCLCKRNL